MPFIRYIPIDVEAAIVDDGVVLPGFWQYCICSKQMVKAYNCMIGTGIGVLVFSLITLVWCILPTVATILSWFYWQDNADLYDKHPSANDIMLNLFVWNLAQVGLIVAIVLGIIILWCGFWSIASVCIEIKEWYGRWRDNIERERQIEIRGIIDEARRRRNSFKGEVEE